MDKWISVKDRLPKHGEWVLVYKPCGKEENYWWKCNTIHLQKKYCMLIRYAFKTADPNNPKSRFYRVTHWMPLPEPPNEDK